MANAKVLGPLFDELYGKGIVLIGELNNKKVYVAIKGSNVQITVNEK